MVQKYRSGAESRVRSRGRRSRWQRAGKSLLGIATAMLVTITGGMGVAAANAAPPYTTEANVTNISFTESEVTSGYFAELTADWSLPDDPVAPAGFTIALPPELEGRGDTFNITASDTGATIATCVATKTELQCDFDTTYISDNSRDLRGSVNFWVVVNKSVTETQEETFEVGGQTVTVTVNPPPGPCTENCDFSWNYQKDGSYNYDSNTITWYVHVAAPEGGMKGGLNVQVKDTPDANQQLIVDDSTPVLMATNEIGPVWDGSIRPVNWQNVPRASYELDSDGTVRFVSTEGYYYQVRYDTNVLDGGDAGTYTNHAEFTINGVVDGGIDGSVRYAGGGGTGIGDNVGVFSITKLLEGTAEDLPADLTFTGSYVVTTPDGETLDGSFEVQADGTWESPEYPRGSTVHLTEVTPTSPANIDWGTPIFSQNDFALQGGVLTSITLTNTADLKLGKFSAAKTLEGTQGALDLVPADTQFALDYSYPAGPGFPAGGGTLMLGADGTPAESPDLPVGAVVTVTEQTPGTIEGLGWGTPVITPSTFTIEESTAVEVDVLNPVTETLGGFSLKKSVSGDASGLVPEGTIFTVDYAWETPDGTQSGTGTLEVKAGGNPVEVQGIPAGAVVTLTENEASAIDGVEWLDPVFSENGFTVIAGTVVEIDLDNPTALRQGAIGIRKALDGNGASLVPAGTEFTVKYSYPAGEGFEAGSGEIVVRADGVVVQSDPIPFGATVTLEELTPADISGATWTGGKFDIEQVAAGDGTVTNVVLTNTYEKQPEPKQPELPTTGAGDAGFAGWATLAALMLAAGTILVTRKRSAARG